jgi:sulfoxide reductase heme-binding subunit YedZ
MLARLSPYWLWLLLALPAFGMASALASSTDPRIFHELLHPTGEISARFMIIAMLASSLVLFFKS